MSGLKFKVEDKVVLSKAGKDFYKNRDEDPHNLKGVVYKAIPNTLCPYYEVLWDNGLENDYEEVHLELVNTVKKSYAQERMKPFNLEKALSGEPVVCRELGDEVEKVSLSGNHLFVERGGVVEVHNLDGTYLGVETVSPADLFMKTKTEKRWMVIGKDDLDQEEMLPKEKKRYLYKESELKSLVIMEGYQLVEFEVEVG